MRCVFFIVYVFSSVGALSISTTAQFNVHVVRTTDAAVRLKLNPVLVNCVTEAAGISDTQI